MAKSKKYDSDVRKYTPSVGGTDVKSTAMLSGESGGLTPAQNETNSTEPWTTGKAPREGNLGGEQVH
jgi:hypothetical protein